MASWFEAAGLPSAYDPAGGVIVSKLAPGPLMVSGSVTSISDPKRIVPVTPKLITSAPAVELAWVTASRRLPPPLSDRLMTVNVAAIAGVPAPAPSARPIATTSGFNLGLAPAGTALRGVP